MKFAWFITLYNYLAEGSYPQDATKVLKQKIRRQSSKFVINGEDLVDKDSKKCVLHDANARQKLTQVHEEGHQGFKHLYSIAQENFVYERKMTPICRSIIADCITCQMRAPVARTRRNLAKPIKTPSTPFYAVACDAVGPLETSNSGNRYILTGIDLMSRWPFALAVPNINEETTAEFYFDTVIAHYGVPSFWLTDRGSNFKSHYTHFFLKKLGCNPISTTAFRPQCNGQSENLNRNLCRTMAKLARDEKNIQNWDKYLNKALLVLRTVAGEGTKYSPSMLLYGYQMVTPSIWSKPIDDFVEGEYDKEVEVRTRYVYHELQRIREEARKNSDRAKAKAAIRYNKTVHTRPAYKVGDLVLLKVDSSEASKFADRWQGPFTVFKVNKSSGTYYIEGKTNKARIKDAVNGDKLKPFQESKYMVPDITTSTAFQKFRTWIDNRQRKQASQ